MDTGAGHRSVLRDEVLRLLDPSGRNVLVDCTVGLGGHAEALLAAAGPQASLIGIDVDEENLRLAKERLDRFGHRVRWFHADHADLDAVLDEAGAKTADVILADLGVSTNQLEDPQRGLSFQTDGPLDMRLDRRAPRTAADLVNELPEPQLADLIYAYGEDRYSRRIARAIVAARKRKRIGRTGELAQIVARAYPAAARRSRRGVHPATRTFQALRIYLNGMLGSLDGLLSKIPVCLAVGGRAGVISFQSLEDRRVKQAFADWAQTGRARLVNRKVVKPAAEEVASNPKSRSARLRAIERIA
ncbi:MAG TPA: 16S rRNA (cytosine(1402)-N(4))-methyltransferase RsmH [Phycisphaerae bacterium]|nr:16S rRNA (cytosine(1402)-N(4))-methyltransferase RsmH [Phycisphaerae bacterium]